MKIEVIEKSFDMNRYKHEVELAVRMNKPTEAKITKLKLLVQKAYEQGLYEGGKDQDWYDKA